MLHYFQVYNIVIQFLHKLCYAHKYSYHLSRYNASTESLTVFPMLSSIPLVYSFHNWKLLNIRTLFTFLFNS